MVKIQYATGYIDCIVADIQPRVRDKLDVMVRRVTLTWLRGAAMVGTILLPVLVLVGAPAVGAFGGGSGGGDMAVGFFLVIVVLIGVFPESLQPF